MPIRVYRTNHIAGFVLLDTACWQSIQEYTETSSGHQHSIPHAHWELSGWLVWSVCGGWTVKGSSQWKQGDPLLKKSPFQMKDFLWQVSRFCDRGTSDYSAAEYFNRRWVSAQREKQPHSHLYPPTHPPPIPPPHTHTHTSLLTDSTY